MRDYETETASSDIRIYTNNNRDKLIKDYVINRENGFVTIQYMRKKILPSANHKIKMISSLGTIHFLQLL